MDDDATMAAMSSQRPYLLRAIHEWIGDNGMTPHLLVNAAFPGVHVPPGTVKDGKVVLNIAERAVGQLSLGNEYITFGARFGGVAHEVFVPVAAVLAIYARETGQGMALPEEVLDDDADAGDASTATASTGSTPTDAAPKRPTLSAVPATGDAGGDDEPAPPTDEPNGGGPRPRLRVVK